MCDHIRRLDAVLGEFLSFLDGLGSRVLVVVTGDHGGSDFAERLALQGFAAAKRIDGKTFLANINTELKAKLSLNFDPLLSPDMVQFYAVDDKRRSLDEPLHFRILAAAIDILKVRPEVEEAFALSDLLEHKVVRSAPSTTLCLTASLRASCEDGLATSSLLTRLAFPLRESLPTRFIMGHAGPYAPDTSVPIIFLWRQARAQTRLQPVDTTSIAPTLANIMQMATPPDLDGHCLDIGYEGAPLCK